MTHLNIDAKILQDAALFCSKLKTRENLAGISFKNNNGILEIAGTDGGRLYLAQRPLEEGEELDGQIVLKFPKITTKCGPCEITQSGEDYFLTSTTGRALCEKIDRTFPNYGMIVNPAELPTMKAADYFVAFKWEYLRDLSKVALDLEKKTPKGTKAIAPHFWETTYMNYKIVCVLMGIYGG